MTVNQLIKKLEKIRDRHGKRVHVCIDMGEAKVNSSIYTDYSHWSAGDVSVDYIRWEKEGSCELADGSERLRKIVSISL